MRLWKIKVELHLLGTSRGSSFVYQLISCRRYCCLLLIIMQLIHAWVCSICNYYVLLYFHYICFGHHSTLVVMLKAGWASPIWLSLFFHMLLALFWSYAVLAMHSWERGLFEIQEEERWSICMAEGQLVGCAIIEWFWSVTWSCNTCVPVFSLVK